MNVPKLPAQTARPVAVKIIEELREQTINLLEKRAEAWIGENKLIHAGAARRLAAELRQKLDNATN
jgi:hypothetical protein